jgi:hypothetical protein
VVADEVQEDDQTVPEPSTLQARTMVTPVQASSAEQETPLRSLQSPIQSSASLLRNHATPGLILLSDSESESEQLGGIDLDAEQQSLELLEALNRVEQVHFS